MRNHCKIEILKHIKNVVINEAENNSPYILSISFKDLMGEVLLHLLEKKGVLVGVGSACSSKKSDNRVLSQMGVEKSYILGSVRISFSSFNTLDEVKNATKIIIDTVLELKKTIGVKNG
jgi:cysteine desulfurase